MPGGSSDCVSVPDNDALRHDEMTQCQLHRLCHLPEPTIVTSYESFTESPVAWRAVGADFDLGWTLAGWTKPCVAGAHDSERQSKIAAAVFIVFTPIVIVVNARMYDAAS